MYMQGGKKLKANLIQIEKKLSISNWLSSRSGLIYLEAKLVHYFDDENTLLIVLTVICFPGKPRTWF